MHRRKLWLLAGVVLAALALAATGSARVNWTSEPRFEQGWHAGLGAEQGGGPDWCLNLILDIDCNAFWNVRVPDAGHSRRLPVHAGVQVQARPD